MLLLSAQVNESLKAEQLLPKSLNGWEAVESDQFYDTQNLYDLIDGGAELYLSFGFKRLVIRRFYKTDHPDVEVEIFDMGSAENAFGIFQHDLEDEEVGIGNGSEYGAGWLRFWKGHYFVYIFAELETPAIKEAILNFGAHIAQKISVSGTKPLMLNYLPQMGLNSRSIRFFHNYQNLNYYYYLSSENILNFSEQTNAVFARFKFHTSNACMLFIQYQDEKRALQAFDNFKRIYLPEANLIETENGKWTGLQLESNYLIVVLDASDSAFAETLLTETKKKLQER